GDRRGKGAAARMPVDAPFLDEHVQRLSDGRPAHLVAGAERVLGRDLLAFTSKLTPDVLGDLQVARDAWAVVHRTPLAVKMSRQITPAERRRQSESPCRSPPARGRVVGVAGPVRLVLFDCDGVLVDSERIGVRIDVAVLADLGWTMTEADVVERFMGR